jgi:hypothetical protein
MTGHQPFRLRTGHTFIHQFRAALCFTELLPENDILSFGKIRASMGQVGKDADAYATNTYLWAPQIVSAQFVGTATVGPEEARTLYLRYRRQPNSG